MEVFSFFSEARGDIKKLIRVLERLNNHFSTLEKATDKLENLSTQLERMNNNIEKVLKLASELG